MEKITELNTIGTQPHNTTLSGLQRQIGEVGTLLNKIVNLVTKVGDTDSEKTKESGHQGQIRQKVLSKGVYTLEIMTDDGWKEAYFEIDVSGTKYEGKLLFK
mgnify:CR=1 FL=1